MSFTNFNVKKIITSTKELNFQLKDFSFFNFLYFKSISYKIQTNINNFIEDEAFWVYLNDFNYQNDNFSETQLEYSDFYKEINEKGYIKWLFIFHLKTLTFIISLKGLTKKIYLFWLNYISKYFNIVFFNFKWILVSLIITIVYAFISLFYIQIEITKQLTIWFVLLILFYTLISIFNSFLNKYKYGKFTSSIQRFWKRTGIVFWLIEGFLFLLFFYYFLNSSQEPLYMFDYSNLNQELLIQLKTSAKNMILISIAIYLSFILILNSNFLSYYQNLLTLILISLIIFYMLFIETYQFVYIISIFSEKNWIFNEFNQIWVLEFEQNNLRVKQQYFILCLIAKYWHFIFIFISWFFFLIKCIEINKINYNILGYNTQNLIILYVLNLMCLIQWSKYLFKKFLEIVYFWFHTQYDEKFLSSLFSEIFNILLSLINFNTINFFLDKIRLISVVVNCSNSIFLWKYI